MKKIAYILFVPMLAVSCNHKGETQYVKELPPIDSSSTHYAITYDKDGNVIDEYKSEDYIESEKEYDRIMANSHLYLVLSLGRGDWTNSNKANLKGRLVSSKSINDKQILLRSEERDFTATIDGEGNFEYSELPLDSYHLFAVDSIKQLTFVEVIDLEDNSNYEIEIEKE